MEYKECKFSVKQVDGEGGEGTFTGLAAVYGNVDLQKEVIKQGAFTKTLSENGGAVPILWQHEEREPIGAAQLSDSRDGLQTAGTLALDPSVPLAMKAHALLKKKALKGLSIGYDVIDHEKRDGIRFLKEIKLWEISLVTFPANERALISGVKSAKQFQELMDRLRASELTEEQCAELKSFVLARAGVGPPAAEQGISAPEDFHALIEFIKNKEIN